MTWQNNKSLRLLQIILLFVLGAYAIFLGFDSLVLHHPIKGALGLAIGVFGVAIAIYDVATWVKESRNRILPIVYYFLWAGWLSFLTFESWERGRTTKAVFMFTGAIAALATAAFRIANFHKPRREAAF